MSNNKLELFEQQVRIFVLKLQTVATNLHLLLFIEMDFVCNAVKQTADCVFYFVSRAGFVAKLSFVFFFVLRNLFLTKLVKL